VGETTFFFVDESGDQNFLGRRKPISSPRERHRGILS